MAELPLMQSALSLLDRLPFDRRFYVFLVVGGVNTLFGYTVFALLVWLGLPYSLALLLSTILGVLFNFKTTGQIVFSNRDNRLIFRFVGTYAIIYCLNLLSIKGLIALSLNVYAASGVMVLPMAILSFLLNRKFVFTRTP